MKILFVYMTVLAVATANPLIEILQQDPAALAQKLADSPFAAIVKPFPEGSTPSKSKVQGGDTLPTVFAHGMGDSCFNPGMKQITNMTGAHLGTYAVCVPTGDNQIQDTINGFLMTMNKNVDVFAEKIKKDPNLAGGFNAVGFSQGNSVIRGYIQKYNDPPVNAFLSVHGTVSGVAGFPQCDPDGWLAGFCDALAELLGDMAYNPLVQNLLFQANYFRDPMLVNSTAYLENSQIAAWNNEGKVTPEYKTNFLKTNKFIMIRALADTMVFPNEGEHWGEFADGQFKTVLTMNQTRWYKEDLFGLQTADKQGRIYFNHTEGNHLQFTQEQLFWWVDHHFTN